jgi:cyclic pyranopterin phosphate synthase
VPLLDSLGRPLSNLRVSVTDRCNLRCQYCMPEREYTWLPRRDVLDFEEIARLVEVFTSAGVDRVRLTGGEPLVRRDLPRLVELLAGNAAIRDLAITTNGVLLEEQAEALKSAGLHRVTVSLDTLRRDRFEALTRFDAHERVLAGISAVARAGMKDLKIDSVLMRGVNDDEILSLLEYGRDAGAEVRFIEYMDVGGATNWSPDSVFSRREILEVVEERYGKPEPLREGSSAPAERFRLPDGLVFGVIASTTAPFCRSCDRSRLTADGLWYLCLYAKRGLDLRGPLRAGASPEELREILAEAWNVRDDRGAETRLALAERAPLLPLAELRRDPHLEMHTRGG